MSPTPETDAAERMAWAGEYMVPTEVARKLERERDGARKSLEHITEYGTEEINAAIEMRQKAAAALLEHVEAQKDLAELCARYNDLIGVKEPRWYNGREIPADIKEAAK